MREVSQSNLIEMLAAWGAHEARGRLKVEAQFNVNDQVACADFVLRHRAPLIMRIYRLEPQRIVRVEFDPTDSENFMLFDKRKIDDWIQTTHNSDAPEATHFRTLVEAANPPEGPLVTSAQLQPPSLIEPPFTLWDGWHRAAAWRERCRMGKPSPISAFLILTAK